MRDRITSDSEDNTLVAGGGKAGEDGIGGARCRVGGRYQRYKGQPGTALSSRGLELTGETGHMCVSTHVAKLHLPSGRCQGNSGFILSYAKLVHGNIQYLLLQII